MRNLNVRLDDDQYDALRVRADAGGVSVSAFVRDLIGSAGSGEAVPQQDSVEDRASVSPLPAEPNNRTEGVSESPVLSGDSPPKTALSGAEWGAVVRNPATGALSPLAYLAAPLDECPLCSHDRQESDHLGGRPCKFKTSPRRNCGCTFEGF